MWRFPPSGTIYKNVRERRKVSEQRASITEKADRQSRLRMLRRGDLDVGYATHIRWNSIIGFKLSCSLIPQVYGGEIAIR